MNVGHPRAGIPKSQARAAELRILALSGVRLIREGDDLADIALLALRASNETLQPGDVLVIAQKIVSKAEGRYVDLRSVAASPRARELAQVVKKDPRLIELILRESTEVLRYREDVIIVVHRLGFVMANAGIDFSNVEQEGEDTRALLLPSDPDSTCEALSRRLLERTGEGVAVIINDSHGRAWRNGTTGVAIGVSGLTALLDLRGEVDLFGRPLRITQVGIADEIAAAASLVMGQSHEGTPIALIRGLGFSSHGGSAKELIRPRETDLFR